MPSIPKHKETFYFAALGLLFLAGYYDVLKWMLERYLSPDSYYSHGFIVPLVTGYLIWKRLPNLRNMEPRGTWWGLVLVVCALSLHLFSTIIYVFSFSGFTIPLLIWGIFLFLYGPQITRQVAFPLGFLIFMLPVPQAVISAVSFPLKIAVAKTGVWIASWIGVPIHLSGFNITIPAGTLLVGNPCSGLRSLVAFLALGSFLACISDMPGRPKVLLFLLSIPIALASNLIRVPLLILASHFYGLDKAAPDTWVHTGSGILVFALGFLLLYGAARVLERSHAN